MFQMQHKVVLNDRKERKLARQLSQPGAESENGKEEEEGVRFTPRLRVFADVAGYSGVRGMSRTQQQH